ncbi:MAG: MarR family transcriptional regulator [Anaerolineales bacterium]|nr:MarR family transcriptional regulator [Anaerolineales bacterium]
MSKSTKTDLKMRALMAVRDYGVNLTHFRNAMNEWAGLNATDMECLRLLTQKGTATPTELAKHTGLTSGATTAMLDRLVFSSQPISAFPMHRDVCQSFA